MSSEGDHGSMESLYLEEAARNRSTLKLRKMLGPEVHDNQQPTLGKDEVPEMPELPSLEEFITDTERVVHWNKRDRQALGKAIEEYNTAEKSRKRQVQQHSEAKELEDRAKQKQADAVRRRAPTDEYWQAEDEFRQACRTTIEAGMKLAAPIEPVKVAFDEVIDKFAQLRPDNGLLSKLKRKVRGRSEDPPRAANSVKSRLKDSLISGPGKIAKVEEYYQKIVAEHGRLRGHLNRLEAGPRECDYSPIPDERSPSRAPTPLPGSGSPGRPQHRQGVPHNPQAISSDSKGQNQGQGWKVHP